MINKFNLLNFEQFPGKGNDLEAKYVWQIWILRASGAGIPTSIKLFYSWIVPTHLNFKGWGYDIVEYADNVIDDQNKNKKIELLRADYYGTGTIIRNAIIELLSKQLSEITWDGQDGLPPNSFLNITLAGLSTPVHVIRPEVMIPKEHLLIPWPHKAITSPVGYSIFVSQIINLDKLALITFQQLNLNERTIKKTVKDIAQKIKDATGFDITRSSAPRIGNIEWYRLPISDELYRPLISCSADKTGEEVATGVVVHLNPLPPNIPTKNISISCRIINGEEVTFDELREITWGNIAITETFLSEQPVCDFAITIWAQDGSNPRRIIFEDYYILARQIVTKMSVVGSVINSGRINMLDKLIGKEEKSKPVELAQYHRSTLGNSSVIGTYEADPWINASRDSIEFMKNLYPDKSEGHFFINGWDKNKGATGQLSFVEWMFDIVSGSEQGGLILIDPFFDMAGLEIFSNARTTNTHFRILTCTQHRDKIKEELQATTPKVDLGSSAGETGKQHATELANACEKMRLLLQELKFYLLDLRSKGEGKRQLFHDRYILLTDAAGIAKKGFHLSNSIQGATRNEPLLVTPIPEDILPEVLEYVEGLINSTGPAKKQTEIITLYPAKNDAEPVQNKDAITKITKIEEVPNANLLFSILLKDTSLMQLSNDNLIKKIAERGVYDIKNDSFLIYNLLPEHLESFAKKLSESEYGVFEKLINAWGNVLARGQSYDHTKIDHTGNAPFPYEVKKELTTRVMQYPSIAEKLVEYLESFKESKELLGHGDRLYSIFNTNSFEESFVAAFRSLDYTGRFFNKKYGLLYAVKLLVYAFPSPTSQFLDKLIIQVKSNQWNEGDSEVRAQLLLLTTMTSILFDYHNRANLPLQEILLNSNIQSTRAASCAALHSSLSINYQIKPNFEDVLNLIQKNLPDEEYRMFLAYFISNLQLTHRADKELLQPKLFERLLADFKSDIHIIDRIVCILGGWLKYDRADFVTTHFLKPLVKEKRITPKEACEIWHKIFLNKVCYYENYKEHISEEKFCQSTDKELTVALLDTFLALESNDQHAFIQEWINAAEKIWAITNQPFTQNPNHSQSTIRLFWVNFMIRKIYETISLPEEAAKVATTFLDLHAAEIELINKHVREDLKYVGIVDIENIKIIMSEV